MQVFGKCVCVGGGGNVLARSPCKRGPSFGPNVKKPTLWAKGGGDPDSMVILENGESLATHQCW